MSKITLTLCDVQPCSMRADRTFQMNGRAIHVCGEGCYVKYWSREYQGWKQNPYELKVIHIDIYNEQCSGNVLKIVPNNAKVVTTPPISITGGL